MRPNIHPDTIHREREQATVCPDLIVARFGASSDDVAGEIRESYFSVRKSL